MRSLKTHESTFEAKRLSRIFNRSLGIPSKECAAVRVSKRVKEEGVRQEQSLCADVMQADVLEELQHHFPLDLLMQLSTAATEAMQVLYHFSPSAHPFAFKTIE